MQLRKVNKVVLHNLLVGMLIAGIFVQTTQAASVTNNASPTVTIVLTIGSNIYTKNGESFSLDVPPYISSDNRTMVPIRFIAEGLGAKVTWNDAEKTDYITLNWGNVISCKVGEALEDSMGTPVIKNDRLFVPIRYVATSLGADVNWDAGSRQVTITMSVTSDDWVEFDTAMKAMRDTIGDVADEYMQFDSEKQVVHFSYDSHNTGDLSTLVIDGKIYVNRSDINQIFNFLGVPPILSPSEENQ